MSRCPELEVNVQRLVPGNPFGGWLRTPSVRHILYCSHVPTATSKFQDERNPIVPHAILIGDQHASLPSWFVFFFLLSHFPLFFSFSVERSLQGGSTTMETERVYFFFGGEEWRGGDISCSVPFDEALRMSNAVQSGSDPEGQGRGIRKLWYSALVCGLIVSFLWSQRKLSIQQSQWACSGNRWNHCTQPMGQLYRVRQSTNKTRTGLLCLSPY